MSDIHSDVIIETENNERGDFPEEKIKKIRAERDTARKEAQEYLTGWQRSKADYINLQKRMQGANETAGQLTLLALARSIVPVFDSLEAGFKSAENAPESVKNGFNQVISQLEQALKEHGILRYIPNVGDLFDPTRHEPVQTLETLEKNLDNTVTETYQSGYEVNGMVIRPARVAVMHYQSKK